MRFQLIFFFLNPSCHQHDSHIIIPAMEKLVNKYSLETVQLACARQGILPNQLAPYPPRPTNLPTSPERKIIYDVEAQVHNDNISMLHKLLLCELKLLHPVVKKYGDDEVKMLLIPHKSVSEAKKVQERSFKQLPQAKAKVVVPDDFEVPETVVVPEWLDADGDGIISYEEYQVLEREMARANKLSEKNRKNIQAIVSRELLREEKEKAAMSNEAGLEERKKLVKKNVTLAREKASKRAQERIAMKEKAQKLMADEQLEFKKRYAEQQQKAKLKEKERQRLLMEKKKMKILQLKEKKERLQTQVEAANQARANSFEKALHQRQLQETARKRRKLEEEQQLKQLAIQRQMKRKEKLKKTQVAKKIKLKKAEDKVNKKLMESNERKKGLEDEEEKRIHELSRDTKRKAMENLVRKKFKAAELEQRALMLIEEERIKTQLHEAALEKIKEEKMKAAIKKKKSLYAQKLRNQRNQRIREHRHEMLRLKAEVEKDKDIRRRAHQKELLSHRRGVTLLMWKEVDLLKKKMERNSGDVSEVLMAVSGAVSGGSISSSPQRPKYMKTIRTNPSPRLFQPKIISPKRQELEQKRKLMEKEKKATLSGARSSKPSASYKKPDLQAYAQKHEAITHLKHTSIEGQETLHVSFR